MANNFYLNQDPLLFQSSYQQPFNEAEMRRQFDDTMNRYKMYQQKEMQVKDYIGDLDILRRGLNETTIQELSKNEEFKRLNENLTNIVQNEIMSTIKSRLNNNTEVIKNIERQTAIIEETNKMVENEQMQNLNELNDYVKNYSNITFDEYKRLKNGTDDKADVKLKRSRQKNND